MKKIFIFILSFIYITTSSGVMINMHYCMGEFVELNFSHNKEKNCSNCGMKEIESKGCCENEQKILKIDNEQKITNTGKLLPFTISKLSPPFFETAYVHIVSLAKERQTSNALLQGQNLPIFILNGVFLI